MLESDHILSSPSFDTLCERTTQYQSFKSYFDVPENDFKILRHDRNGVKARQTSNPVRDVYQLGAQAPTLCGVLITYCNDKDGIYYEVTMLIDQTYCHDTR